MSLRKSARVYCICHTHNVRAKINANLSIFGTYGNGTWRKFVSVHRSIRLRPPERCSVGLHWSSPSDRLLYVGIGRYKVVSDKPKTLQFR